MVDSISSHQRHTCRPAVLVVSSLVLRPQRFLSPLQIITNIPQNIWIRMLFYCLKRIVIVTTTTFSTLPFSFSFNTVVFLVWTQSHKTFMQKVSFKHLSLKSWTVFLRFHILKYMNSSHECKRPSTVFLIHSCIFTLTEDLLLQLDFSGLCDNSRSVEVTDNVV